MELTRSRFVLYSTQKQRNSQVNSQRTYSERIVFLGCPFTGNPSQNKCPIFNELK